MVRRRCLAASPLHHMSTLVRIVFALLVICALREDALAQATERTNRTILDQAMRSAHAVRVERSPKFDGTLDDPIWQQAVPITDFRQKEPYEGQPATERTEVRILYTHDEIYFGVACWDSVTRGIVATQLRRDVTQELDDYFEIVIDSRHDRRNAYVFQINPLGTQRDALITNEEAGETQDGDPGWDGVWTSEDSLTGQARSTPNQHQPRCAANDALDDPRSLSPRIPA